MGSVSCKPADALVAQKLCHVVLQLMYVRLSMVALCNRADHYILPCGFYLSSFFLLSFFFPRLISAVGDWMSTILPHMVWP